VFDAHVHAAPDVSPRLGDDADIAAAYADVDFDGFVLKAHYESTVGRARAVARATGMDVVGGLALNQHCGGVNPSAVAAALGSGGRVIWMPTADSHLQEAAGLPRLCDQSPRLPRASYAIPPVDPDAEAATEAVLAIASDHDAVVATGHLSIAECRWLAERWRRYGGRRLLFTHPTYTVPGMDPSLVTELAELGGFVEITAFQLFHQPGCTPAFLAQVARAAGPRLILSSDAGQPDSPAPPAALHQLIDVLADEGVDRGALLAAASTTPADLFRPR